MVGGHELTETMTAPFPSTGWIDAGDAENADTCAWISSGRGASANITRSRLGRGRRRQRRPRYAASLFAALSAATL